MTVLDVGCGVGKPAREIATFTGCQVVGLNNNGYQVERAAAHAVREKLEGSVRFEKGDFMVSRRGRLETFIMTTDHLADLASEENQLPGKFL